VGKAADLVILSENIFELPPERVNEAGVLLTLFGGKAVHAQAPFDELLGV